MISSDYEKYEDYICELKNEITSLKQTIFAFQNLERGWYAKFGYEPKEGTPHLDVLIDNFKEENHKFRKAMKEIAGLSCEIGYDSGNSKIFNIATEALGEKQR